MKTYISIIIILLFTFQITAQTLNQEIVKDGESPFLLGEIDKQGLTSASYNSWFSKNYEDYELDLTTINHLKSILKEYNITLFMGTWCGDSKREVPRFYKILDATNFPKEQLKVVALSRTAQMYKQSPNHEEAGLNIHRVPTFIFYKNNKEVNRIVESPVETLEKDIFHIVTNNDYQPNYRIVTQIDQILKQIGLKGLKKKSKKLIKSYRGQTENMFELNTYGRILYGINQHEEAIEVFRINNLLFPNEPRTYMSLANTLGVSGEKEKAIVIMEKAVKIFPENIDIKKNLEVIRSN